MSAPRTTPIQRAQALSDVEGGVWTWRGPEDERLALAWELEHSDDLERGAKPCERNASGYHRPRRDPESGEDRCTLCGALVNRGAARAKTRPCGGARR